MGDVLRTTPLLTGLKRKYPDSFITWLTYRQSRELLAGNRLIDRLYTFSTESTLSLMVQRFDLIINLDKEPAATSLTSLLSASKKTGFGMSEFGNVIALNAASDYSLRLGIDDELKFRMNEKTYQELIFESSELEYDRDPYILRLDKEDVAMKKAFLASHGVKDGDTVVGLNTGSGKAWITKQWPSAHFIGLAHDLTERGFKVVIMGGPEEEDLNARIMKSVGLGVIDGGCRNSLMEFAALVDLCDLVVSSDTIAMHVAIATSTPVIVLFGPTCAQEVELYDNGAKISAGLECSPCYKSNCETIECMSAIEQGQVLAKIEEFFKFG